jgi:MOSC domain-containing protein
VAVVGIVESLWRYPVKSMRGEEIQQSFLGFSGVYGDRLYAFRDTAGPREFPFLTGREQEQMLLYQPRFRHPELAASPLNLAEAESGEFGLTPLYPSAADLWWTSRRPRGRCSRSMILPCSRSSPQGSMQPMPCPSCDPIVLSPTAGPSRSFRSRQCNRWAMRLALPWTNGDFERTYTPT